MQIIYDVFIKGTGGHGSMPHKANNPILIAAGLISQLCELPAVTLNGQDKAGIQILRFDAGEKGNIIPEQAKAEICVYAEEEEIFCKLQKRLLFFGKEFVKAREAEIEIKEHKLLF